MFSARHTCSLIHSTELRSIPKGGGAPILRKGVGLVGDKRATAICQKDEKSIFHNPAHVLQHLGGLPLGQNRLAMLTQAALPVLFTG